MTEDIKKTPLMEKYEQETGKNAIWQGSVTKSFKEWKENQVVDGEKKPPVRAEREDNDNSDLTNVLTALNSKLDTFNDKINRVEEKIQRMETGKDDRFKKEAKEEDIERFKDNRENVDPRVTKIVDDVLGKDFGVEIRPRKDSPGMMFTLIVPERLSLLDERQRPKTDAEGKYIKNEDDEKIYESYKPEDRRSRPIATGDNFSAIRDHCQKVRAHIVATYNKLKRPLPEFKLSKYENL